MFTGRQKFDKWVKGRALLPMRCLHCGKRLSLLRKFSDGEFCSADHRALFERLNNDLGLQRLIASQSGLEREKPKPLKKQVKQLAAESQVAAQAPPLGELVPGCRQAPVILRQVSQPGLPPLLGPKESSLPRPALRAQARGFAETVPIAAGVAPEKVAAAPALSSPQPIVPLAAAAPPPQAGLAPDVELLPVQSEIEREPALIEALSPLMAGTASPREIILHEPLLAAAWLASTGVAAPRLALRMLPPGRRAVVAATAAAAAGRPAPPLVALREIESVRPLRPAVCGVLAVPGGALPAAGLPATPDSRPTRCRAGLRRAGLIRLRGRASARKLALHAAATPVAAGAVPLLQSKLGLSAAAVLEIELQIELPVGLLACAAGRGMRWIEPVAGRAPAGFSTPPPLPRALAEPLPKPGGLESIPAPAACQLQCWRAPGVQALPAEPGMLALPVAGLRPQVPTVGEALEFEVLSQEAAAGTEPPPLEVAPAEPREEAPPLHDVQWRMPFIRPLDRPIVTAGSARSSLVARWRATLETAALCPPLRLRIDHADGSGSRAARVEWRTRAGKDRFRLAPERIPGGRFWHNAPADLKWIALALPLILALVVWSFRGPVSPVEASLPQQPESAKPVIARQVGRFQQVLLSRAAVRLYDDFRGGLGAWHGPENWARSWKYSDSSFLEPGELALYTPTLEMRDYTMEFLGQIERRSLNWVFRAKDTNNYYAMRIVITRGGPLPAAAVVRYRVIGGKEAGHVTLPLPISIRPDTVYRVRMDVRGRQFTTYVQGQVVDNFDDDRLPEGGVGFWSPRGDRSLLRWVEVMHQYDYLGRLCALLAPYPLQAGGQQAD